MELIDLTFLLKITKKKKLQVFDKALKFVGHMKISNTQLHRPSGLVLDMEETCLYVLNLKAGTMHKLVLKNA